MKKKRVYRKKRKKSITKAIAFSIHRFYTVSLIFFILALLFYLYFLFASIYYTSVAKDTQFAITALRTELSELEASYVKEYEKVGQSDFKEKFVLLDSRAKEFARLDTFLGRAD